MMSVKSKNIHVLPTDKPSKLFYNVGGALLFTNYENHNGVNIYITSDEEIKEGDWILNETHNIEKAISHYNYKSLSSDCKKIILTTDQDLIKDGVQAIDDEFLEWFVKNPSCERIEVNGISDVALGGFADVCYKIIIPITTQQIINEDYAGGLEMGQIIPKEEPKQELEKEMFELEQELDIPSHLRWHNSKPKQETQGYICPQTKKQCDDECCVSAEDCHIEASLGVISDCEPPKQETLEEAAENYTNEFYSSYAFKNLVKPISIDGAKWQQERMYSYEEVLEQLNLLYSMKNSLVDTFTDENDYITMKWFEQFKNK